MTTSRRLLPIILTFTTALALISGRVGLTAAPSSAATTTFTQTDDLFGGAPGLKFSSDGPISVPGSPDTSTQGPATPYADEIHVPYAAPILDLNLQLHLTHTAPDDLDLLLVAPEGQSATVMSDSGGSDDTAPSSEPRRRGRPLAPDGGPLASGTYPPTNHAGLDVFPAPAPFLYSNSSLEVFDGTNANGTWRLFAMDDAAIDTGAILDWTLTISMRPTPYPSTLTVAGLPPVADVDVVLDGFTTTYADDMDVLVVGPAGQEATLMSDAEREHDADGFSLTFDDEAGSTLPDEDTIGQPVLPADRVRDVE